MLEKILLSIAVTFSLYICLESHEFPQTSGISIVQRHANPNPSVNP